MVLVRLLFFGAMAGGRFFVAVASLLVSSRILYEVVRTGKYAWRSAEDAPTTNGRTRMTGPQQTTDSSLIILYLICSYTKRSLMNNSNYCDLI